MTFYQMSVFLFFFGFFICKTVIDSKNSIYVHLNGANKTEWHDKTEIVLKVVLSTINQTKQFLAHLSHDLYQCQHYQV
jgi:hypothetical protein